jgi:hypothetical protein
MPDEFHMFLRKDGGDTVNMKFNLDDGKVSQGPGKSLRDIFDQNLDDNLDDLNDF